MSKHETPLTLRYWESVGGTLIEEFLLVPRTATQGARLADAVILPDGPKERLSGAKKKVDLTGKDVIVVQTKRGRLNGRAGMTLLGQAFLSAELLRVFHHPLSVRSVAVCRKGDAALEKILKQFPHIEIVTYEDMPPTSIGESIAVGLPVPRPDADWQEILEFAHDFDGYAYWGSADRCAELGNAGLQRWEETSQILDTLEEVRTCLFYESRRRHHTGVGPFEEDRPYIAALLTKCKELHDKSTQT